MIASQCSYNFASIKLIKIEYHRYKKNRGGVTSCCGKWQQNKIFTFGNCHFNMGTQLALWSTTIKSGVSPETISLQPSKTFWLNQSPGCRIFSKLRSSKKLPDFQFFLILRFFPGFQLSLIFNFSLNFVYSLLFLFQLFDIN